ncbi:hypothetical protein DPSP01_012203 [Paraphaeosphaeria sporulosa]|uniref:4Fe-4S ferredoxin-type domain-containing protein n=1 Tax=Paraphaeosphaeria sporulosa TaxID=1460663 RepID=A0A177CJT4_9PLEO|nr:uncharacterized protein CC84DRAFT_1163695 [Paraphaeosphaeria sporulosa]OAG07566.1 hypothetical protein CC84DRAFT_1163695 [Paraphaeosphaeria sporulosa]
MYTNFFSLALILPAVLGAEFSHIITHDFSAMLRRSDALTKRQGYYPSSQPCGSGTNCAEACGAGQVECPADAGRGVCFDPSQSQCCPDGSGYSCDSGYFCSSDGQKNTYCCPNGMDLGACAQAYSLTVSLISQTGTVDFSSQTESASAITTSPTPVYITSIAPQSSSLVDQASVPTTTVLSVPAGNSTYATGSPPVEFPGVATKTELAGMVVFAGLAVFVGVLVS